MPTDVVSDMPATIGLRLRRSRGYVTEPAHPPHPPGERPLNGGGCFFIFTVLWAVLTPCEGQSPQGGFPLSVTLPGYQPGGRYLSFGSMTLILSPHAEAISRVGAAMLPYSLRNTLPQEVPRALALTRDVLEPR
jgi:hypothetical protein